MRSSDVDGEHRVPGLGKGPGRLALSDAAPGSAPEEQAPLGSAPTYDEVLDLAVEYSFPCSDPIAVHSCCTGSAGRRKAGASAGDC